MTPLAMFAHPVPPFVTGRTPITFDARSMDDVPTTPPTDFRKPVRFENLNELETVRFDVDAVPVTTIEPLKVDVAVVDVALNIGADIVP